MQRYVTKAHDGTRTAESLSSPSVSRSRLQTWTSAPWPMAAALTRASTRTALITARAPAASTLKRTTKRVKVILLSGV